MSHPLRFDPDDPLLAQLRSICLDLPEADEKISHGNPAFFTTKIFSIFGAVVKGDHDSDRYSRSVLFMVADDEQLAIDADERFFTPAYWGPYGWRGLRLDDPDVEWAEVAELVDDSYRLTARPRLVAELDRRRSL